MGWGSRQEFAVGGEVESPQAKYECGLVAEHPTARDGRIDEISSFAGPPNL
jgi:hypothetical protein